MSAVLGANPENLLQVVPPTDWRYEMRRDAQEIIPGLYCGPFQSSKDYDRLKGFGITHVLCIYDEREALFIRPRFPNDFVYKLLDVRDAPDQNLIRLFPDAKLFIDQALQAGGRILVHCGDGISRSPAIVTAYVMTAFNLSQEEAFQYVQARRFCISPNLGFQHQLEAYQHIHEASVAISNDLLAGQRNGARRKRCESDDDEDDEMDVDMIHRYPKSFEQPEISNAVAMEVT